MVRFWVLIPPRPQSAHHQSHGSLSYERSWAAASSPPLLASHRTFTARNSCPHHRHAHLAHLFFPRSSSLHNPRISTWPRTGAMRLFPDSLYVAALPENQLQSHSSPSEARCHQAAQLWGASSEAPICQSVLSQTCYVILNETHPRDNGLCLLGDGFPPY